MHLGPSVPDDEGRLLRADYQAFNADDITRDSVMYTTLKASGAFAISNSQPPVGTPVETEELLLQKWEKIRDEAERQDQAQLPKTFSLNALAPTFVPGARQHPKQARPPKWVRVRDARRREAALKSQQDNEVQPGADSQNEWPTISEAAAQTRKVKISNAKTLQTGDQNGTEAGNESKSYAMNRSDDASQIHPEAKLNDRPNVLRRGKNGAPIESKYQISLMDCMKVRSKTAENGDGSMH